MLTCRDCGTVLKCPNCDISLTYHKSSNTNRCHYCNYSIKNVMTCPKCGSNNIKDYGMGTEKLEEELKKMFQARVIRMDMDTTSKKGMHEYGTPEDVANAILYLVSPAGRFVTGFEIRVDGGIGNGF